MAEIRHANTILTRNFKKYHLRVLRVDGQILEWILKKQGRNNSETIFHSAKIIFIISKGKYKYTVSCRSVAKNDSLNNARC
jgi:hypothetical protein